jgi:hypothetical protein
VKKEKRSIIAIPGTFVKVESEENVRSEQSFTGFKGEGFEGFGS